MLVTLFVLLPNSDRSSNLRLLRTSLRFHFRFPSLRNLPQVLRFRALLPDLFQVMSNFGVWIYGCSGHGTRDMPCRVKHIPCTQAFSLLSFFRVVIACVCVSVLVEMVRAR